MENRIQVIKAIRQIGNVGLAEAVNMVNHFDMGELVNSEDIELVKRAIGYVPFMETLKTKPNPISLNITDIINICTETLTRFDFNNLSENDIESIHQNMDDIIDLAGKVDISIRL